MTDTVYPTRIDLWDFFRMLVSITRNRTIFRGSKQYVMNVKKRKAGAA